MLLKLWVLHQRAGAIAAVADTDDGKLHTCRFHLVPINAALILGNIDAEGGGLLHAGGIKIIELVVDALDAGDRLVGVLVVVIGLAVLGAPAGILRRFFLILAEEELPQPLQQAVFTGQAGGVYALFVQRAAVQCLPDLFRGQQNGAVDILDLGFGQHILAVLGSGRRFLGYGGGLLRFGQDGGLLRSGHRVLSGQRLGLCQEVGEGVFVLDLRSIPGHGVGGDSLRLHSGLCSGGGALCRSGGGVLRLGHGCGRGAGCGLLLRRSALFRLGALGLCLAPVTLMIEFGQGDPALSLQGGGLDRQARRLGCQQEGGARTANGDGCRHHKARNSLADAAAGAVLA